MRKQMRFLSCILATAMVITSVPVDGLSVKGFADVTQTSETQDENNAKSVMLWKDGKSSETISVNAGGLTKEQQTLKVDTTADAGDIELNSDLLDEFSKEGDDILTSGELANPTSSPSRKRTYSAEYTYQWYEVKDGEKKELTDETEASYDEVTFENTDTEKKYVCVVTLDKVYYEDSDGTEGTIKAQDLTNAGYTVSAEKEFILQYTEADGDKDLLNWADSSKVDKSGYYNAGSSTYDKESKYVGTVSISGINNASYDLTAAAGDAKTKAYNKIARAFGLSSVNNVSVTYGYRWYKEVNGDKTLIDDETGSSYYPYESVYAKDGVTKYIRETYVRNLSIDGTNYDSDYIQDMFDKGYDFTADAAYTYTYTGLKASDFDNPDDESSLKTSDYFYGTLEDETEEITMGTSGVTLYPYVSVKDSDEYDTETAPGTFDINYTWTAVYKDDTTEKVVSYSDEDETYSRTVAKNYNDKRVKQYVCAIDLCYNGIVIKSIKKTYNITVLPITISTNATNTVQARNGSKKTFKVEAAVSDDEFCKGIKYQWYTVDKDGKATAVEGETLSAYTVKISDYATSYKCVVTPVWKTGHESEEWSGEVAFAVTQDKGYKVTGISDFYTYTALNKPAELYIDASVDAGYTLKYKWEKAVYDDDENVTYEDLKNDTAKLTVTPAKNTDFNTVYNDEECYSSYNYRLTVSVYKDGAESAETEYKYYFRLSEEDDDYGYDCETNGFTSAYSSEDIIANSSKEMYVKPTVKDGYMVKNTWYKPIAVVEYYWDDNDDKVYLTEEPPETYDTYYNVKSWYSTEYQEYVYRRVYYTKLASPYPDGVTLSEDEIKTTLTLAKVSGDAYYMCSTEVYDTDNHMNIVKSEYHFFNLDVYTDLSAYAKESSVEGELGKPVSLEVVAQNADTVNNPITYQWMKDGVAIEGATGAVYNISEFKLSDVAEYSVTVSDKTETRTVSINLTKKTSEPVVYTPSSSYYTKAIGEEVTLNADIANITDATYTWYHTESIITYDASEWGNDKAEYDDVDWELIGEDTSSYTFKLESDSQYGTYKCVVNYKYDDKTTAGSKTFVYTVNDSGYTFEAEKTTPSKQYKQFGDSVSYGVNLVTNYPGISADKIKYTWYYLDGDDKEKIKDATSSAYTIDKLTKDNLKEEIYCEISCEDISRSISVYFYTELYTDAYLKETSGEIEADEGTDVTLAPEIVNGDAYSFTYKWYKVTQDEWGDDAEEQIYSATDKSYTIKNISETEFGTYRCKVFYEGVKVLSYDVKVSSKEAEETFTLKAVDDKTNIETTLGGDATLAVVAQSDKEVKYQWYKVTNYDGDYKAIGGATSAEYKVVCAGENDFSYYTYYKCVATDSNGEIRSVVFSLSKKNGVKVDTGTLNDNDTIGYETTIGGNVTITVNATQESGKNLFYQWYKYTDSGYEMMKHETGMALTLNNVTEEMLGMYRCKVSDASGNSQYVYYKVYTDDAGLVVNDSNKKLNDDGSVTMSVQAFANEGEKITYQWSKQESVWDDEEEEYITKNTDIEGATSAEYTIPKITKDSYGTYVCTVSARGNSYKSTFNLGLSMNLSSDKSYAVSGEEINLTSKLTYPATDTTYTYEWYVKDNHTGTNMKIDADASAIKVTAPQADMDNALSYSEDITYMCRVMEDGECVDSCTTEVTVFKDFTFVDTYPETAHPDAGGADIKGYKVPGARALKVEFDSQTDLKVKVYGSDGYECTSYNGESVTVTGDTVILVAVNESTDEKYGYKVKNISVVEPGYDSSKKCKTEIGGSITLNAGIDKEEGKTYTYQWYKGGIIIEGQTSETLELKDIKAEDLTRYYCKVTSEDEDGDEDVKYIRRELVMDTGLKIDENLSKMTIAEDGSVKMNVSATANDGETITYKWSKNQTDIEGAVSAEYTIPKITKDSYGCYVCTVSTRGETKQYSFELSQSFYLSSGKSYVAAGEDITLTMNVANAASDAAYTYDWYVMDEFTGEYEKIEGTTPQITVKAPVVKMASATSYANAVTYKCIVKDGDEVVDYDTCRVNVFKDFTYSATLPETSHPMAYGADVKGYKLAGARAIKLTIEVQEGYYLPSVYDADGEECNNCTWIGYVDASDDVMTQGQLNNGTTQRHSIYTITVDGDTAIVAMNNYNSEGENYGYKVTKAEAVEPWAAETKSYCVTFGGSTALTAEYETQEGKTYTYQWYKGGMMIAGQTSQTLSLSGITTEDLGKYYCGITSDDNTTVYSKCYVYVDTKLRTQKSSSNALAAADGTVTMYVNATAQKGESISYKWYKVAGDTKSEIANATTNTYKLAKITSADYGIYCCVVSTSGEEEENYFYLNPAATLVSSKAYAFENKKVKLSLDMENAATDATYTYKWYEYDHVAGDYKEMDVTTSSTKVTLPAVTVNNMDADYGCANSLYMCEVYNGTELVTSSNVVVKILPALSVSKTAPATEHPFDKTYDIQKYKDSKASSLTITFDSKTDVYITVIDAKGNSHLYNPDSKSNKLTVTGNTAIFMVGGNDRGDSYGYSIKSIKATYPVPKKGKVVTSGKVKYKVTKSAAKNGTVMVSGTSSKNIKKAVIAKTVKINGYTFKVTSVAKNAFKNCKKLKSVTVGDNVTTIGNAAFSGCKALKSVTIGKNLKKIGSKAFYGDKKLKTIKISSAKLKTVGAKALKGINSKARVKVPSSKVKSYTKIFKGKGQGKKVKVVRK